MEAVVLESLSPDDEDVVDSIVDEVDDDPLNVDNNDSNNTVVRQISDANVETPIAQSVKLIDHRTQLPTPRPNHVDAGLIEMMWRNVGKDLTKVSLPITLNEPLSALQVNGLILIFKINS